MSFLPTLFFKRQEAICLQTKERSPPSPPSSLPLTHNFAKAKISQSGLSLICPLRPSIACYGMCRSFQRMSTTMTNIFTCPVSLAASGPLFFNPQTPEIKKERLRHKRPRMEMKTLQCFFSHKFVFELPIPSLSLFLVSFLSSLQVFMIANPLLDNFLIDRHNFIVLVWMSAVCHVLWLSCNSAQSC